LLVFPSQQLLLTAVNDGSWCTAAIHNGISYISQITLLPNGCMPSAATELVHACLIKTRHSPHQHYRIKQAQL